MKSRAPAALLALFAAMICLEGSGMARPGRATAIRLVRRDMEGANKFFALKYEEAMTAFQQGQIARATALADAILLLHPRTPMRDKLNDLRDKCQQAQLQQTVLEGDALVQKKVITHGEKAVITFRLRNVGPNPIRIPTHVTTKSRWLLPDETEENNEMLVKFTEIIYTPGAMRSETMPQMLTFDEEIKLGPGEEWSETFEVNTRSLASGPGTTSTLRIVGSFMPLLVETDGRTRQYNHFVLKPAVITVMPRGWTESVDAGKPLESLSKGLESGNLNAVFYAAALIGPDQADTAVKRLIAALQASPPESRTELVIMASLSRITGRYYRLERDRWLDWWKARSQQIARKALADAKNEKNNEKSP